MDLERFIAALDPLDVVGRAPVDILELAYDARLVEHGSLFFCVPGTQSDGHDFASEALGRGAVALVVERPLEVEVPQLVVESARHAMAPAADLFFGSPTQELAVCGITGTNGKTTTSFLLYEILAEAGMRPGLLGTVESRVGGQSRPVVRTTPEAIDLQRTFREMVEAGNASCVMEVSSHAIEMRRVDDVRFAVHVFTNLSQDHLDFHGTMEKYFAVKRRLFFLGPEVPAAINIDNPYGRRLAADLRAVGRETVVTFGVSADADLRAEGLELDAERTRMRVDGLALESPLRGSFNTENVLAAVAVARLLGVRDEAIVSGVAALGGVPGRFQTIDEGQPFAVIVDYAHTPDALARVLEAARELCAGRVLCVFGCGGDRDRDKRPQMGAIAAKLSDIVVVTSDNPRSEDPGAIVAEILSGIEVEVEVELDRREAIRRTLEIAEPGDVVIVAGKGHEQGQEIAGRKLPFDDREVARSFLREEGGSR